MAEFGWAYVAGGAITGAAGPTGSVLLKKEDKEISGSANLIYNTSTNVLNIIGGVSSSVNISASAFYGDGSNLSGISSVNIANDANNRILTADGDGTMSAETNLTFDGSKMILSGNLEVSGSLFANEIITNVTNKNVVNISATGSTSFGDSADDTHTFTGAITGSKINLTGLAAGTATTSSYLAVDSNNNIVLTSSSGGGGSGTIGAAEDGSYTDGLYTDFVTSTPVGTAIDRFNEVLKILAPSPAPNLSRVNTTVANGISAKLSFGASNPVADYTSSATAAGFSAVARTGIYGPATSGNNIRLGIYDGTQDILGLLNFQVSPVMVNGNLSYASGAFGNANEGTLKLELNGDTIHSVSLAGFAGSGNPATGSATSLTGDSGFTHVSVAASSFDGNGAEWYIFKHRTARYKIDTNEQKVGWNYIRAIHTVGGTDYATNYVEWINDPSGAINDLSVNNARIENISLIGSKHLSGVRYNTDATANYKVDINNLYKNVYADSGTPISFTVTNSTTPAAQSVPDIGGSENNTKVLGVTGSLNFSNGDDALLSGSITANVSATHPFKNSIINAGSATTGNGFLIDNRTNASSNLIENFHDETYRKQSGSFNSQGDVTGPGYDWNSSTHMTVGNGGHSDGLIMFNQRLYSPIDGDIPNGGNFSSIANVDGGQPNYSGISGTRTFYREVQNTSGSPKYNIRMVSSKTNTTINNASLGTNNVNLFIKIPGVTGWMDVSQNFVYGNISDGDGALISGASNDTDSGNNNHHLTFGTASLGTNEYLMVKIVADASWTGHFSVLGFVLGASSDVAATPQVLSDIDANDSGTSAKLSFGTSNPISGYSNVQGAGLGSMSTINSNATYAISGDRRGVFTSKPTLDGEINEAIPADGVGSADYPAKAFFNAFTGSLILEVNGSEVHNIALANLSAINTTNGNGSRLNVSSISYSTTANGVPDYFKPYRTGNYEVAAADQVVGWNYARLIHRTNSDATTNYVEWVVDTSGAVDNTSVSSPTLSNFGHTDIYYQSGIGYFASPPTASFDYTATNFYNNVYSTQSDAISFGTTTNCSISNIRVTGSGITTYNAGVSQSPMPALNNTSDCELTDIHVTGTVLLDSFTSISGGLGLFTSYGATVASTVKHPLKTNRTTANASKSGFMVYSGSAGSTNLNTNEYFNTEDYRIVSGNYASQTVTTSSANAWNPQTHMNGANAHGDGMVTANGFAISPLQIGKAGDTRNKAEVSTGLQAPAGNPNYSTAGLSDNIRTYYRYFKNETGLAKASGFSIKLYGDAYLCAKGGSFYTGVLGANKNINVELKVPFDPNFTGLDDTSTAWADIVRPYQAGVQPTTDGVGVYSGGNSDLNQTVGGSGRAVGIQLLEKQIRNNQFFVLKISAHKDWTGYLSRIEIVY